MELDDALGRLGKLGKWQVFHYITISLATCVPSGLHMMSIVFIGADPGYQCKVPENRPKNQSIPKEVLNDQLQYSQCRMYDVSANSTLTNSTAIVPCKDGYDYNMDLYGSTILTDFGLVCDKAVLLETSQAVFTVGVVIGALICPWFADKYGRRPVFLFSQWGMIVFGLLTAFAPDYYTFVAARFFCGALEQGIILPGFVLACELFQAKQRTLAGMLCQVFWPMGLLVMDFMAYFIRDWRYIQMAITLPGLLTIALYWILNESMPWLIANGKYREAEEILQKAAKMNNVEMPENILLTPELSAMLEKEEQAKEEEEADKGGTCCSGFSAGQSLVKLGSVCSSKKEKKEKSATEASIVDVLRSLKLCIYTLVMSFLWMVNALVYFGISLNSGNIGGNMYVTFAFSAIVEMLGYAICIFALKRFGRRVPICIFHIITGVSLLAILPISNLPDLEPLLITLAMVGKAGISASFGSVFLYATEIYPTNARGICLGICSVGLNIGSVVAPYLLYAAKVLWWLPGAIFGTLSVLAGLATLYLPETLDQPLPQTIEDVVRLKRSIERGPTREKHTLVPGEEEKNSTSKV